MSKDATLAFSKVAFNAAKKKKKKTQILNFMHMYKHQQSLDKL